LFWGTLLAWGSTALPSPWAWFVSPCLVLLCFVPRTRGTRAAFLVGAILECACLLAFWSPVPRRADVDGLFEIKIQRQVRDGRYEAIVLKAPKSVPPGSKLRVALDSAAIGDFVRGAGHFRAARPPANPGGFDEARWAASSGLVGSLRFDSTIKVGREFLPWDRFCQKIDLAVRTTLASRLDAPSADLWIATLLADGTRLPEDVNTAFRQTGLYHMLSVSGFHLVVLGGAALMLFSLLRLGSHFASLAALCVVWLYIAVLGFPDPAVRSGVAFTGFILARWSGRRSHAGNALGVGSAILILLSPNCLFQMGVQLTISATAALIWVAPGLESLFLPRRSAGWIRSFLKAVMASVAATLATAPLLAWNTGLVPWIGIPAGILASGFFSAGFLASLAVAALGALPASWSSGFAGAAELCARAVLEIALRAGSWDAGWFHVMRPSVPFLCLWSILLILISICSLGIKSRRRALVGFAFLASAFLVENMTPRPSDRVKLVFFSVGQGDATLIRFPGGDDWLFDGGPRGFGPHPRDAGADIVVPALRALRVRHLSGIGLTHPDLDHWGGLPSIAAAFVPDVLMEASPENPEPSEGWNQAKEMILKHRTRPMPIAFGQNLIFKNNATLVCLAPGMFTDFPNRNDDCLVLSLRYGQARALLAGDAEHWAEDRMVERRADLRAQILKVGHHGSKGSSSLPFLETVRPRWAVLSVGERNRFGHPHRETLDRLDSVGATILDTRNGAWQADLHADGRIEIQLAEARWWDGPWEQHSLELRFRTLSDLMRSN